jgi:hypothetical protein
MPQRDQFDDQKRSDEPMGGDHKQGSQRERGRQDPDRGSQGGGMNERDRRNREREEGQPKQS